MGKEIQIPCGQGMLHGYLSMPEKGEGPGIIVLQEWWGLNSQIKDVADRLSDEGYVALAPDLYHGKTTDAPDEAQRVMMQLNIDHTAKDLLCAVSFLKGLHPVASKKMAVLGFCMGGQLALYAASLSEDIAACIDFYGIHPNVTPDFTSIRARVLGLFGARDPMVTPERVQELDEALTKAGVAHEFISYEKAGHAFFNDAHEESYCKEPAEDAFQRVKHFLKKTLV